MEDLIKPKRLSFAEEMGVSSHSPKYPSVAPVQPINTNNQNAQEVKIDFVSDEEVGSELGPDYEPPCSQITHKTNIWNAKELILERRKKETISDYN